MTSKEYYSTHKCPVCGKFEFPTHGSYDVCPVCGWEDDYAQETEEKDEGGANWEGLKAYRALYKAGLQNASDEKKLEFMREHGLDE